MGFVADRSCVTNLLEVLDDWTRVLDEGGTIDAIYMDLMKAFDTVPHQRLLIKLESFGICGNLLSWLKSFLTGRRQKVVVGGKESSWGKVMSGVPQGSVLGPTLFLIFVNDLPDVVKSNIIMFADDTKLYLRSDTRDSVVQLQSDLSKMEEWAAKWQLRFHPEKCIVLRLGKKNIDTQTEYHMKRESGTVVLKEVHAEKDLGVLVDSKLSFKDQVSQVALKGNRVLGIVRRTFVSLDADTILFLFKGLIRPILEYGQAAWSPYHLGEQRKLESVQRRATKMIPGFRNMSYRERLTKLKLPTLAHRRRRGDMIDVLKYLILYDTVTQHNLFYLAQRRSGGHKMKLDEQYSWLDLWICETARLPEYVISATSVNC